MSIYWKSVILPIILFLMFSCQVKDKVNIQTGADFELNDGVISFDSNNFKSKVEFGNYLVKITGCHDCHTPKILTPNGLENDLSRALSGYPEGMELPSLDRKNIELSGLSVTKDFNVWFGTWGVSFASNITSDETGIGDWTEDEFFVALRGGKSKGIITNRSILPPMPNEIFLEMTDEEISAIYAYLQSTRPVKNLVPEPLPPILNELY